MGASGKDALLSALDRTGVVVTRLLREVHQRAPKARVLVVGYPQIVVGHERLSRAPARPRRLRVRRAGELRTHRDAAQGREGRRSSQYVDVWAASKGHDICSADPWINGSVDNEKQAARYHPFAKEQAAVADLVVQAIR